MKFNMFSTAVGLALAASLAVSGCSTGNGVTSDGVSGSYAVVRYPGLSDVPGSTPARWTSQEVGWIRELDEACRSQLGETLPGRMGTILRMTGESALFNGLGVAAGAAAGFPGINATEYLAYGAGAGAGSGAFAGYDRAISAYQLAESYCMVLFTHMANQRDGVLDGIGIVPWYGRGDTRLPAAQESTTSFEPRRRTGAPPPPPLR